MVIIGKKVINYFMTFLLLKQ